MPDRPPRRFHATLVEVPEPSTPAAAGAPAPAAAGTQQSTPPKAPASQVPTRGVQDPRSSYVLLTIEKQRSVRIPVTSSLFAQWKERFKTNTDAQNERRFTLMQLMEAAYLKGLEDGRAEKG